MRPQLGDLLVAAIFLFVIIEVLKLAGISLPSLV